MARRAAQSVATIPPGLDGPTLRSRDLSSDTLGEGMDPFLAVSVFDMTGPAFPPHPHAGFAVATYVLPESEGAFRNHDSTGFANRIAPGGLHATVAGRGVLHEEANETDGVSAKGLQIWLNLRAADKLMAPRPLSLEPEEVPVAKVGGATIRVLLGRSNGAASPLALPTPARLADVELAAGAAFDQDLAPDEGAFLVVLSGAVEVVGEAGRSLVRGNEAARLKEAGDALRVEAGPDGARLILFAGVPLREPVVQSGPFVGSSQAQVEHFWSEFRAGRMGRLDPFATTRRA